MSSPRVASSSASLSSSLPSPTASPLARTVACLPRSSRPLRTRSARPPSAPTPSRTSSRRSATTRAVSSSSLYVCTLTCSAEVPLGARQRPADRRPHRPDDGVRVRAAGDDDQDGPELDARDVAHEAASWPYRHLVRLQGREALSGGGHSCAAMNCVRVLAEWAWPLIPKDLDSCASLNELDSSASRCLHAEEQSVAATSLPTVLDCTPPTPLGPTSTTGPQPCTGDGSESSSRSARVGQPTAGQTCRSRRTGSPGPSHARPSPPVPPGNRRWRTSTSMSSAERTALRTSRVSAVPTMQRSSSAPPCPWPGRPRDRCTRPGRAGAQKRFEKVLTLLVRANWSTVPISLSELASDKLN